MILTSVISSLILISPKCSEISYIKKNELLIYDYGGKDTGDIVTLESVGLKQIIHNSIVFKKKKNFDIEKNRCIDYCTWLSCESVSDSIESLLEDKSDRQCAGFTYLNLNISHYECSFKSGTIEFPPEFGSNIILDTFKQADFSYFRYNIVVFETNPFPPPFSSPSPPVQFLDLVVKPEVLIPLIVASVFSIIIFIYLFRLCNKERANSFNFFFSTIFGSKKNNIVVNTQKNSIVKR